MKMSSPNEMVTLGRVDFLNEFRQGCGASTIGDANLPPDNGQDADLRWRDSLVPQCAPSPISALLRS